MISGEQDEKGRTVLQITTKDIGVEELDIPSGRAAHVVFALSIGSDNEEDLEILDLILAFDEGTGGFHIYSDGRVEQLVRRKDDEQDESSQEESRVHPANTSEQQEPGSGIDSAESVQRSTTVPEGVPFRDEGQKDA